jgi:hypothetical protein
MNVIEIIMKKLAFLFVVLFAANLVNAQIVVDAEMFKANPNMFMGKTITIKNPKFINKVTNPGAATGAVSAPSAGVGVNAPAATGVIPTAGGAAAPAPKTSTSIYCNPLPNHTLTKWELGINNSVCIQVQAKDVVMLPVQERQIIKEVTFRVTPTMYLMTRCVIK